MGKYLIKSSETKDNKKIIDDQESSNSILFGKELGEAKEEEVVKKEEKKEKKKEEEEISGGIKSSKDHHHHHHHRQSVIINIGEGGRWNYTRHKSDSSSEPNSSSSSSKRRIIVKRRIIPLSIYLNNLIAILIAMTLWCSGISIASPTPSLDNDNKNLYNDVVMNDDAVRQLDNFGTDDYDFSNEDTIDSSFEEGQTGSIDSKELDKLRKTIMDDLGLKNIPDPKKANVSQTEYEKAYREYLKRVELSNGQDQRTRRRLHVFYPADPVFDYNSSSINFTDNKKTPHSIYFPVEIPPENHAVDHAVLRILISHHNDEDTNHNQNQDLEDFVEVSIYQPSKTSSRRLIANQRVSIGRSSSRWAEFDSTEAVASWYHDGEENLGFQMEITRHGAPVRWNEPAPAALNVFTISDARMPGTRNRRATPDQLMSLHRGRRTECKGQNKKCCRHQMMVIFKDLKGFEFIIQPKDFDAGYCKGRCPPRYNPAHHHALLQSLIWKEDRKKAPRPCCAPSKLTELEILYFDENDSSKLKVSNWKNMKVLECACS